MDINEKYYKYIENNKDVFLEFIGNKIKGSYVYLVFEGEDKLGNVLEVRLNQNDYNLEESIWAGEGHRLGDFTFDDYTDEEIYVNTLDLVEYLNKYI